MSEAFAEQSGSRTVTSVPNLSYHHLFEPAEDPAKPPLLLLHGTGGDEHDLLRIARAVSPKSAFLSPRGDVSEGGARRFFARLAEGVFDPEEVKRRTHALADFVAAAAKRYAFDSSRLIAVGFSNGANIAATLLQLRPESLGAAVLFRPMAVLDQPAQAGSLNGKRVLVLNGNFDPIVPANQAVRLSALLEAGGAEVTVQGLPASHALTSSDVAAAQAWLEASDRLRVSRSP
jgi:phospholipase/carboxylesterase